MKYIRIEDICEMLSISRRTLERMRAKEDPLESILSKHSSHTINQNTSNLINNLRNRSFPKPDFFIGKSPRWEQDGLISWLKEYGKNLPS